jgi:glycosyltransferase involved in cell wall biosynthesis
MRIVHINLSDAQGGAAIAARRLHQALRRAGHDSRMLVWRQYTDDPAIAIFEKRLLPRSLSQVVGRTLDEWGMQALFHPASHGLVNHPWVRQAEVIHLHQAHGGYFDLGVVPRLSRERAMVWTLHDLWAFTGHCAMAAAAHCDRWQQGCGHCPDLQDAPAVRFDGTAAAWRRKERIYRRSRLTIVTPSAWLADKVRQSPLLNRFPVYTVPNGLDTGVFRPVSKALARSALGLPADGKVLMFAAASLADPRKGVGHLRAALTTLPPMLRHDLTLLLVGGKAPAVTEGLTDVRLVEMGRVEHERLMALCYAAADVFVMASWAENLPNSLVESLACGTPAVCFAVGGCPEIVTHMETGYLARPGEATDLGRGLALLLHDDALRQRLAVQASARAQALFAAPAVAARYLEVYARACQAQAVSGSEIPLPAALADARLSSPPES